MTLDALFKEVEALYARPIAVCHGQDSVTDDGITALFTMHHRAMLLARMLREAVGALKSSRDIIKRLPKHEVAGKYCAACSEKSGWDAWERAEKNDDPSGLACDEWCPTPAAYRELAAIKSALSRLDAMAGEVGT